MSELLRNLNPTQFEAASHVDGPLMIIAGAGTGKTRVITHRIAFLAREIGIPLNQILAVTFTNKAAKEMRERVERILGSGDIHGLAIGTFHARCALILRRESQAAKLDQNFAILDDKDQNQAIRRVLREMEISEKRARPAAIAHFINQAKMRLLTPKDCEDEFDETEVPFVEIYAKYQETIEKAKSIDFEDLMMKTVLLFQQNEEIRQRWADRYRYVLIDEYQDTNHAQFLLSKLLAQDHKQICVVGDEDQSIYSWRGAEISNLLDFQKTFPGAKIVKLELNYRSTGNILKAAGKLIERNTQRIGKTLYTEDLDGEPISFGAFKSQEEEGQYIARECWRLIEEEGRSPDDIAIFYRSHWLSRGIEDALRKLRLPYRMVGGLRFYDRAEIKDLLSFLRLAVNPEDDLAFERVVNRPTRGVGAKAMEQIERTAAARNVSWFRASRQLLNEGEVRGTAKKGLEQFLQMVEEWGSFAEYAPPIKVLERILSDTDFKMQGVGDLDSIEADSRLDNISEFAGVVAEFETQETSWPLASFLQQMALDATAEEDTSSPRISLLTIHNAKGLEYDTVFTVGLEKGVFPTSRAEESGDAYAIEEERRLFYVAITRARRKLYLSYSMRRSRPEMWNMTEPSMFLRELPPEVFDEGGLMQLRRILPYGYGNSGEEREYAPRGGGLLPRVAKPAGNPNRGKPRFEIGTRVRHQYMGEGVICELGGRPGFERVLVHFDDGRTQEFVVKYAPLTAV